jgi:hypothetical protein
MIEADNQPTTYIARLSCDFRYTALKGYWFNSLAVSFYAAQARVQGTGYNSRQGREAYMTCNDNEYEGSRDFLRVKATNTSVPLQSVIGYIGDKASLYFKSKDDGWSYAIRLLDGFMSTVQGLLNPEDFSWRRNTGTYRKACSQLLPNLADERQFIFDEPLIISQEIDPLLIRNTRFYWYNWLIQHAFLEACQSYPTLNDNSISNVIEIAGFIKALVVDHRIEIPKRAQDAWLQYRYVYNTTKMDAEEAISFMSRTYGKNILSRKLKCYGTASTSVGDVDVVCRCTLNIEPKHLGTLDEVWRKLQLYGLTPDFYVVWDMIPYSFIVDWLIPVGDMLSVLDANSQWLGGNYDITDVIYSLSYYHTIEGVEYKSYSRWVGSVPRTLNEFYWFDKPKTSDKVKLYRLLDTGSLLIR